jgi:hypothetical protein
LILVKRYFFGFVGIYFSCWSIWWYEKENQCKRSSVKRWLVLLSETTANLQDISSVILKFTIKEIMITNHFQQLK